MQELDDYINRVQHLPPAPKVLPQLMGLLNKDDVPTQQVVQLLSYDMSLTAGVLQLCNSAFLGAAQPASDLQEAVNRLGFRQVYRLVVAISGARLMSASQKGYGIDEGELWQHAVTTAVAAQLIARHVGEDDSVAFTAGLLHDIGKIVLSQALEHIYTKVINDVETNQQSLLETEKKLLGVQHAEIGGRLLARWKFPSNIVAAIWFHHHPGAATPHQRLTSCVYLGNMISYFIGRGYGFQAFAFRGRTEALDILKLQPDDLPKFMIQTIESFDEIQTFLSIKAP